MKLLIVALLTVFSTNVLAEWTRVGGSDIYDIYADLSTIRKSGDKVKMWDLLDFKVVQRGGGKSFLSMTAQTEYDCKEKTRRSLAMITYSKNMGDGEIVYSPRAMQKEPRPIPPGSVGETAFKVACGK